MYPSSLAIVHSSNLVLPERVDIVELIGLFLFRLCSIGFWCFDMDCDWEYIHVYERGNVGVLAEEETAAGPVMIETIPALPGLVYAFDLTKRWCMG